MFCYIHININSDPTPPSAPGTVHWSLNRWRRASSDGQLIVVEHFGSLPSPQQTQQLSVNNSSNHNLAFQSWQAHLLCVVRPDLGNACHSSCWSAPCSGCKLSRNDRSEEQHSGSVRHVARVETSLIIHIYTSCALCVSNVLRASC